MRFGSLLKRCIAGALTCSVVMFSAAGCRIQYVDDETTSSDEVVETAQAQERVNIRLWYCDSELTGYLEYCAAEYETANNNVHITLTLIPEADYIDTLTTEAIKPDTVDMYIVDNDKLEQVKLAGIAGENRMTDIYNEYNYSVAAMEACTYDGRLIAYPLTFDTSFLIYNASYVQDVSFVNFEEIKNYAENFEVEAGSGVSSIFTCDPQDIFYNYGYLGAYLNIGGKAGDNRAEIFDITDELTQAAELYKQLIEYFYIDINNADYYSCLNGLEDGSIVLTIGDMAMYRRAVSESAFQIGTAALPDMSESIKSAPLSVTTAVVVNPFSDDITVAESFAKYLTYTNTTELYTMSGQPACRIIDNEDDNIDHIYESYDKSVPKLKLMYSDEFYAMLEIAIHSIADGSKGVDALTSVRDYLVRSWSQNSENGE